jgi:hypothetical protein
MDTPVDSLNLNAVALFPLPNVVLLPRAVLPLHIFEFRYRVMTADVLQGAGLVAMALLMPGWEKDYHGRPTIEPVVCVGQIRRWEQLPDGKYNFLLQGVLRATIEREFTDRPYRYAMLRRVKDAPTLEIDLLHEREKLKQLFNTRPLADLPTASQFQQFITGPLSTSDVADLVAFHFIDQPDIKQEILSSADVRWRVRRVIDVLESQLPLKTMFINDDRAQWN